MIKKSALINLIFFFCFFPFIKFIPGIRAEIQPVSAVLAFFFILVFGIRKDRIAVLCFFFIFIIIAYSFVSIIRGIDIFSVVMLMSAYIFPFFIFLALRENVNLVSVKIYFVILMIYLITGILQYLNLFDWAKGILEIIVPRANVRALGGGRGVTFLTPEPAYGGTMILLIILSGIFFYLADKMSLTKLYVVIASSSIMFLINKSGTAIFLILIFLISYLIMVFPGKSFVYKFYFLIFTFFAILIFMFNLDYLIDVYTAKARYVKLLKIAKEIINSKDIFSYRSLSIFTAERILTVIIGYFSVFDRFGCGHGVASYLIDSKYLSDFAGVKWNEYKHLSIEQRYVEVIKPTSYASQISMDTGILGLFVLLLILFYIWYDNKPQYSGNPLRKRRKYQDIKTASTAVFITSVFMILLYSTTTLPVPWIFLAYFCSLRGGIINGALDS